MGEACSIVHAMSTSPKKLLPTGLGAVPTGLGALLTGLGALPRSLALPTGLGALPTGLGALPRSLALPTGLGALPSGLALPTGLGALPTGLGALPTGLGALPTGLGALPHISRASLLIISSLPSLGSNAGGIVAAVIVVMVIVLVVTAVIVVIIVRSVPPTLRLHPLAHLELLHHTGTGTHRRTFLAGLLWRCNVSPSQRQCH